MKIEKISITCYSSAEQSHVPFVSIGLEFFKIKCQSRVHFKVNLFYLKIFSKRKL